MKSFHTSTTTAILTAEASNNLPRRRLQSMKPVLVFVALIALVVPSAAAERNDLDGYWWDKVDASFKLGWVSGYARAMDLAGISQMARCAATMPLYVKEFPNTDPEVISQKMCLSDNTQFDYDGISMGQFVDGMNAFYKDYRNKQLEVGSAIEYARDAIKGKPSQELDAEVALWRRCTAADKSHPMPRSSEDAAQISKACTHDPPAK